MYLKIAKAAVERGKSSAPPAPDSPGRLTFAKGRAHRNQGGGYRRRNAAKQAPAALAAPARRRAFPRPRERVGRGRPVHRFLPLYGLHFPLCLAVCLPLQLDVVVAYLAANISNPLVAPFLVTAEVEIGSCSSPVRPCRSTSSGRGRTGSAASCFKRRSARWCLARCWLRSARIDLGDYGAALGAATPSEAAIRRTVARYGQAPPPIASTSRASCAVIRQWARSSRSRATSARRSTRAAGGASSGFCCSSSVRVSRLRFRLGRTQSRDGASRWPLGRALRARRLDRLIGPKSTRCS